MDKTEAQEVKSCTKCGAKKQNTNEEKKCSKCLKMKTYTEFNKDKTKKYGYHTICKDCEKESKRLCNFLNQTKFLSVSLNDGYSFT